MKTRILVCLLGLALSTGAYAQKAFRVLINKGKNEFKSGSNWQPIKVGATINTEDEIKVTENSYLGLVHVNGKSLEVKDAGTYKVTTLAAKMGEGSSVLNKYTDFILSNNAQKKSTLTATGAVHRGPGKINVFLPKAESAIVFNNKVIISWDKDFAVGPYIVTFKSMFGDELKKEEVATNSIAIDLSDVSFVNEDNFLMEVVSKTDRNKISDPYTIKKLSKADKNRINTAFNEIKDAVADQTAINKLQLAGFYEQNSLLIDAATAYQEAIKLAPDVTQYKEEFNDFLLRNGIKELPVKK